MKAEFKKVLQLFEELEEAGESATLTISSRKGISTIKLLLESSPTLPTTSTTTPTLPPAPGKRHCHRGAKARARHNHSEASLQAGEREIYYHTLGTAGRSQQVPRPKV